MAAKAEGERAAAAKAARTRAGLVPPRPSRRTRWLITRMCWTTISSRRLRSSARCPLASPAGPKDVFVGAANFSPQLTEVGTRLTTGLTPDAQIGFTPLDEAIVRAVERGKSTEVKRRLYGTIVLLGGGARTPGLAEFLEWRVHCCWRIAMDSTEGIDKVEVVRLPVGTEPDCVVWFGAAVLPALETGRAMWILQKDWEKSGALAARRSLRVLVVRSGEARCLPS